LLGLSGVLIQWIFDRQALYGQLGLVAVVMSASGAHRALENQALADAISEAITQHFPHLNNLVWSKAIVEKFSTFACTPNLKRPPQQTPLKHFYPAGDYTASDYPATLESAVQSGVKCAHLLLAEAT
jgi:hydroxysqualene dehydroxylase